MSSILYSIGRWAFRARTLVVSLWIILLVVLGGCAVLFNQGTDNTFSIPGTESQDALDTLSRTFPQVSGTSAQLVIVAPKGEAVTESSITQPVKDAVAALTKLDGVSSVSSPYADTVKGGVAADGSAAIVTVQLTGQQSTVPAATKAAL